MKSIKVLIVLLFVVFLSINAYGQLWKQYSDSAKIFRDQNKIDSAISYYFKAKELLQKDSAETKSYTRICDNIGNLYYRTDQLKKAESLYLEAKQIREKILGKYDLDYALSCNKLGGVYLDIGDYQKAESLYIEVRSIREKVLGKENSDYASSCNNLAGLYGAIYQYEKAEQLYIEAMQIYKKLPGKNDRDYAASCDNLASIYMDRGKYEKAEPLFLEAKQIREKIVGKEDPDYAASCINLAILYRNKSEYRKAELLQIEAKQIDEKLHGKEHSFYLSSCSNLAVLYMEMGQYAKAEPLYIESKNTREKRFGKENPDYAASCNNLALLYLYEGQYEKAEPLFLEALAADEKLISKDDATYAVHCDNLGLLYRVMGQYEKSEAMHLTAKRITEIMFTKENPAYVRRCNNLGGLYVLIGLYNKADSLYTEAKQILEKRGEKNLPIYASICEGIATIHIRTGQYQKAEPLYLAARQVIAKTLGKEHIDYANNCSNLGSLYSDKADYKKAELLFLEAYHTREKAVGKAHPDYIESCISLGGLYRNQNKSKLASDFYIKAFQLQNAHLAKVFQFTSEVEKQSYLVKIAGLENKFLSFIISRPSPSYRDFTYTVSLSSRNLTLSSSQQLRNAIYSLSDTSIKNKYNNWINSREQIAFWNAKPITDWPPYLNKLEEQANTLEKELTRLSSDFKNQQQKNEVNWKNIQQNLKTNEASIEFVEFRYSTGKRWTDSAFYIALVLRKDTPEPVLVQLFEQKELDKILNNTESLATDNRINTLYRSNKSLYNLIWKPLEKYLTGISKVYFASAGNLFKISFAALPVNDKQVLGDKYQLIQLNTTATVTDKEQSTLTAADKIQLYGGIKYDADSSTLKQAVASYQSNTESSRSLPSDLERGAGFQFLPGTQKETESIKKEIGNTGIPITILSGTNATEESIKALTGKNSPSVLHIATHGFFFPDPKDDKRDSIQRKFETSGKVFKQSDNPLFRSGLLFAGANNAWQGKPIDGIEDGILTAYEVSNLYLPNTKLVVLSACETALGDIQGSEGVYGLQRAFKMAGVQNLVMSLWKVPDAETAEFMQLFYKNLFAKQAISNAFYNAQKLMKDKYRTEPYKWAAWVLVR